jgi:serine/threonine-protein kinase RsbW
MTRSWELGSDLHAISPVIDDIVALCRAAGYSARHCQLNVPVAVTEAIANAILRGNGSASGRVVLVTLELNEVRMVVRVVDEGPGFDLQRVEQSPSDADWFDREEGRGIFLMRSLMDAVENACPDERGRHCLRLILHRT